MMRLAIVSRVSSAQASEAKTAPLPCMGQTFSYPLFGSLGQSLVFFGDLDHGALGVGIGHLLRECESLNRALAPVIGIVDDGWHGPALPARIALSWCARPRPQARARYHRFPKSA